MYVSVASNLLEAQKKLYEMEDLLAAEESATSKVNKDTETIVAMFNSDAPMDLYIAALHKATYHATQLRDLRDEIDSAMDEL